MTRSELDLPRDLGDGLLLRWATVDDTEQIVAFNTQVHADGPDEPAVSVGAWTADLMGGKHPIVTPADFTVVVDTNTLENGRPKLVSSLVLLSQTWCYDGIEFGFGQPELVGTLPGYRRRGLIRAQMDAVHELSRSRGELAQGITGIPWYYRLFGYEMTVNLGGSRSLYWARHKKDAFDPHGAYTMRTATLADVPLLQELYARAVEHSHLSWVRSDEMLAHIIAGQRRESDKYREVRIVEEQTDDSASVDVLGYFVQSQRRGRYVVEELAVAEGKSMRELGLFIAKTLQEEAEAYNVDGEVPIISISFGLGEVHPLYTALGNQLERLDRPYAWYMRVPDIAAFLTHVRPVLERRLQAGVVAGHTGQLKLNLLTAYLKLQFEKGKLVKVAPYEPNAFFDGDVFLPDQTLLHLLFGHRTIDELNFVRKDCWAKDAEAHLLMDALFPKQPASIRDFV